uniref:NHR domain-containing protein n=1 Tax=Tetraodon nigroviridis TaxID=99883 RepID=H3C6X2_TETNG
HSCGRSCLGPLTFHCQVLGDKVSLSHGCRLATRMESTFKNGLVFSSRPVSLKEKIHLKVVRSAPNWHGALRVGFTSVHPAGRSLPLAPMAIPDLSEKPNHWAAAVHESYCTAGSELKFWVSSGGKMLLRVNYKDLEILQGVDVSKPLWAMIDIYGQTSSIFL